MSCRVEEAMVLRGPAEYDFQRLSGKAIFPFHADTHRGDQPGFAQLAKMLGNGRLGHIEFRGELFHGTVRAMKQRDNLPASRMGNGSEDCVHRIHK